MEALEQHPDIEEGLIVGGAPCQPFTSLSRHRTGFDDERSGGVRCYVDLVALAKETYPKIREVLTPIFESLDLETLQRLNGQVAVNGVPADTVARDYLDSLAQD